MHKNTFWALSASVDDQNDLKKQMSWYLDKFPSEQLSFSHVHKAVAGEVIRKKWWLCFTAIFHTQAHAHVESGFTYRCVRSGVVVASLFADQLEPADG